MYTLEEYSIEVLSPSVRRYLAQLLGVSEEAITPEVLARYIEQLPDYEDY